MPFTLLSDWEAVTLLSKSIEEWSTAVLRVVSSLHSVCLPPDSLLLLIGILRKVADREMVDLRNHSSDLAVGHRTRPAHPLGIEEEEALQESHQTNLPVGRLCEAQKDGSLRMHHRPVHRIAHPADRPRKEGLLDGKEVLGRILRFDVPNPTLAKIVPRRIVVAHHRVDRVGAEVDHAFDHAHEPAALVSSALERDHIHVAEA